MYIPARVRIPPSPPVQKSRSIYSKDRSFDNLVPFLYQLSMKNHRIFKMAFSKVYPAYIQKAEKKGRSKEEVDTIIKWLTGYDQKTLSAQIKKEVDIETFFAQAPQLNPNVSKITGVICGYRVEDMEDGLMKKIRYLDKLIDELAKGKAMEKILRT
jgi:hypothetical protein